MRRSSAPRQSPWFAPAPPQTAGTALIIGAGLAGCHTANVLLRAGWTVTLIDAGMQVAAGASGNHCGLLKPHVSRSISVPAEFYQHAWQYTRTSLQQCLPASASFDGAAPPAVRSTGALQLAHNASDYPDSPLYQRLSVTQASAIANRRVRSGALFFAEAGWLQPAAWCHSLISTFADASSVGSSLICEARIVELAPCAAGWEARDDRGRCYQASIAILAAGHHSAALLATTRLPLMPARGQTTCVPVTRAEMPHCAVCGQGYVIPVSTADCPSGYGLQIGATFQRGVAGHTVVDDDNLHNIASLHSLFAESIAPPQATPLAAREGISGWAATRATTPDRLPCVGAVPDAAFYATHYHDLQHGRAPSRYPVARYVPGLYLNSGHGSRGLLTTALAAELLGALITGTPASRRSGLPQHTVDQFIELLHPARFWIRQFRKKQYNSDTAAAVVTHSQLRNTYGQ